MSHNRFALIVVVLALLLAAALSLRANLLSSGVVLAGDPPANTSVSTAWRYEIPSNFIQPAVPYNVWDEIQSGSNYPARPMTVREAIPSEFIQPVAPSAPAANWRYAIPSNFSQPVMTYDVYAEISREFSHLPAPKSLREAIPSEFIQPVVPDGMPQK